MKTKLYQLVLFLCSCAMLVACESEDDRQTVKDGIEDVIEGYKIPLKIEDRYWSISIYFSDKTEDELSSYWKRLQAKLGAQESNTFDYESCSLRDSFDCVSCSQKSGDGDTCCYSCIFLDGILVVSQKYVL